MTPRPGTPTPSGCDSFRPGHTVHYLQARLSFEIGRPEPRTVETVADDGTVTFSDGSSMWNHDPARIRGALMRYGNDVQLGSYHLLRVPTENGARCFSLADEPDPCAEENTTAHPGESMLDELQRRGGFFRSGRAALAERAKREVRKNNAPPQG